MNKQTKALKMAIEALDDIELCDYQTQQKAIQACKEALEQPPQEPVAWMYERDNGAAILEFYGDLDFKGMKVKPLYTNPAPLWQGLSWKEIQNIGWKYEMGSVGADYASFARAIEQALKEKNT